MSEPNQPHSPGPGEHLESAADIDPYGDLAAPADSSGAAAGEHGPQPAGAQDWQPSSRPLSYPSTHHHAPGGEAPESVASDNPAGPSDAISAYQVHQRRGPILLIVALAVLVVAGIVVVAVRPPSLDPKPSSAPVSSAISPPVPSSSAGAASVTSSIPVSTPNFSGTWTVDSSTWDSAGVVVQMTMKADSGSLSFSFFGLDNSNADEVRATGEMSSGQISAGQTLHGQIRMDKSRGDTTLILAGPDQRQITALLIPA